MTRAKQILKETGGASMVLVGVVTLILFFVGISVLFAASNTASAQAMRQETASCGIFAKDFARLLTEEVEGSVFAGESSPWKAIAQSAYQANSSGGVANPAITDAAVELNGTGDFWLMEDESLTLKLVCQKTDVRITRPYVEPVPAVWGDLDGDDIEEEIAPAIPEVLEQAEITILLAAEITVSKGESAYHLRATYEFSGTTQGEEGRGKVQSGAWSLLGYDQK